MNYENINNAENTLFTGQTAQIYCRFWNMFYTNPQTQPSQDVGYAAAPHYPLFFIKKAV